MTREKVEIIIAKQREYFNLNITKSANFRMEQLKKLKRVILKYEDEIANALSLDLNKSYQESYLTEIGIVLSEIDYHLKRISKYVKPQRVSSPLVLMPSSSKIMYEPLGVVLVIAPWNYPFQLLIDPLVGAIASGNCVVLKASPDAPYISMVMEKIIRETFNESFVAFINGGIEESNLLLEQRFDLIFFTGSPRVGKIVMQAAAKHMTPVVLELGGKSPCIIDEDANLELSAKRVVWGKFVNAGQTCIAPDYLFVHKSVKEKFLVECKKWIVEFFGDDPKASPYYGRIIHQKAFSRLASMLSGEIVVGGQSCVDEKYIAPTIIDNVNDGDLIMQEEIFGPILPVKTFSHIDEVCSYVRKGEKPLAMYYFGKLNEGKVLSEISAGGVCINDVLMHIVSHNLPFGGVGNSGIGKYHGKYSLEVFSNLKPIVKTPTWIDLPMKYVPYKMFSLIKKLL